MAPSRIATIRECVTAYRQLLSVRRNQRLPEGAARRRNLMRTLSRLAPDAPHGTKGDESGAHQCKRRRLRHGVRICRYALCRDIETQPGLDIVDGDEKHFQVMVASWNRKCRRACTRCIGMDAPQIANNLSVQIREGHIIGTDRKTDEFIAWCVQRSEKLSRLKAVVVRATGAIWREKIERNIKRQRHTRRAGQGHIGHAARSTYVKRRAPIRDFASCRD